MRAFLVEHRPVTKLHFRMKPCAFDAREIGLERKGLVEGQECIVVAPKRVEHIAAAKPRVREVRRKRHGLVIGGQRVVIAMTHVLPGAGSIRRGP